MGHLEDVRSDFSVFHRVDEIEEVPASSFFPKAKRLVAYKGAVRLAAETEADNPTHKRAMTGNTKDWQKNRSQPTPEQEQAEPDKPTKVDKHYAKVEHNSEVFELGLIEAAKG